jgi:hypothetical protein
MRNSLSIFFRVNSKLTFVFYFFKTSGILVLIIISLEFLSFIVFIAKYARNFRILNAKI